MPNEALTPDELWPPLGYVGEASIQVGWGVYEKRVWLYGQKAPSQAVSKEILEVDSEEVLDKETGLKYLSVVHEEVWLPEA